ncbi:ATP-dependent helicase [Myroides marinus]|uniref:ATP-dependent DNA helicase n=1 Tax=Myroides marinus TaxID=703342 RepID=UPI002578FFC3|nr:ATP-dependent helicase [Myroides marinus]MDM1354652.1 ATP-dependent helicase [Myroides marinus]MDM1366133.1 ATP-dependent helicase [Myroides marinus]MDM1533683.1 ATP-dependent helicase [Myroides marinus]MDM1540647.1 ATP-dependent helicase [Myroides marinus]
MLSLLDNFKELKLTDNQFKALSLLEEFLHDDNQVFVLRGYAGTGKTTLLKGIVKYLCDCNRQSVLMAPTGRAANIVSSKVKIMTASTVHSGVYTFNELEDIKDENNETTSFLNKFKLRINEDSNETIYFIDEASMISDKDSDTGEFFKFGSGRLLADLIFYSEVKLLSNKRKIVFIGDNAQLPPIGMNFSPALDESYLEKEYGVKVISFEMRDVMRQSNDNPILDLSISLREQLVRDKYNSFQIINDEKHIKKLDEVSFYPSYFSTKEKKIILCYKNKTALHFNQEIRNKLFKDSSVINQNDIVIFGKNCTKHRIFNGEFALVSDVNPIVVSRVIGIKLGKDKYENVRLTWREVTLRLKSENNEIKQVRGYILENYLYADDANLQPLEYRALYLDFIYRHPDLKPRSVLFNKALLNDNFFNCFMIKYGYAVTCHKAQGGEWNNVFITWEHHGNFVNEKSSSGLSNSNFYRWAYTAITRSSNVLYNLNSPSFSPFNTMVFHKVNLNQTPIETIKLSTHKQDIVEVSKFFSEEYSELIRSVVLKVYMWLRENGINILRFERKSYELRFSVTKENQVAEVFLWINGKDEYRGKFKVNKTSSDTFGIELNNILKNLDSVRLIQDKEALVINENNNTDFKNNELLECFYRVLVNQLRIYNITIKQIIHLDYTERYEFERKSEKAVIDFFYTSKGFFTTVKPNENKCNSMEILIDIEEVVTKIKG